MTSIRTAGLFEFHPVGALTTTFTAPSSCPTGGQYTAVEYPGAPGEAWLQLGSCSSVEPHPECTPNGDAIQTLYEEWEEAMTWLYVPIQLSTARVEFHSPGLACPSAWTTAGVVSSKDGSIDASGVFASASFVDYGGSSTSVPPYDFALNALTSVLEPSETAIICCPSGYTAHPFNGCYSSIDLTSLAGKIACQTGIQDSPLEFVTEDITFDYFGETGTYEGIYATTPTGADAEETGDSTESTYMITYEVNSSGVPNITNVYFGPVATDPTDGLEYVRPILLVNSGEESEEGEEGEASEGGDDENGVPSAVAGSATLVGVVAAVWAVSFLAVCSL